MTASTAAGAPELTLCTRYEEQGASSRLRFYAYRDALAAAGYRVRMAPFFSRAYLTGLYGGRGKSRVRALGALLRRLARTPFLPERLLIEYELFPQLSADFELRRLRGRRFVLNFDDNVWEKYAGRPALADKYDRLCAAASGVIVANDFLAERVRPFQRNLIRIPTVVDLDVYRRPAPKRERFSLCWVGTPVTYPYLEQAAEALRAMARAVDFELVVLARRELASRAIAGVKMAFLDWNEAAEAAVIGSCHAGIMPLPDDPFARGKSAYKLIQSLAAGLPVIASPVGENCNVVTPECGFLAGTPDEWSAALRWLAEPAVYPVLAAGARRRAEAFSLQKYRPVLADFVRAAFGD